MCDAPWYFIPELYSPEIQKLHAELQQRAAEALRKSMLESVKKMQAELRQKREED